MNGQGMEQVSVWQVLVLVLIPLLMAVVGLVFRRLEKLQDKIEAVHAEDRSRRGEIWERMNENKQQAADSYARKEDVRALEERISQSLDEIKSMLRTHLKAAV